MAVIVIAAAFAIASIIVLWFFKVTGETQLNGSAPVAPTEEAKVAGTGTDASMIPVDNISSTCGSTALQDSGSSVLPDAAMSGIPKEENIFTLVTTPCMDQSLFGQPVQADESPAPREQIPAMAPMTPMDAAAGILMGQSAQGGQTASKLVETVEMEKRPQVKPTKGELPLCKSSEGQIGGALPSAETFPARQEALLRSSNEWTTEAAKTTEEKFDLQTAGLISQKDFTGEGQVKVGQLAADDKEAIKDASLTAEQKMMDKTTCLKHISDGTAPMGQQEIITTSTAKLDMDKMSDTSYVDKQLTMTEDKAKQHQIPAIREEKTITTEGTGTQETESLIDKNDMSKAITSAFMKETKMADAIGTTSTNRKSYTGSLADPSCRTATIGIETAKLDSEKAFEEEQNKELITATTSEGMVAGFDELSSKPCNLNETLKVNANNLADSANPLVIEDSQKAARKEAAVTRKLGVATIGAIEHPEDKVEPSVPKSPPAKSVQTASLISITATVVTDKNNDWVSADMEDMMKEELVAQDIQKQDIDNSTGNSQRQGDQSLKTATDTTSQSNNPPTNKEQK
uniref:Uncharacterized protein n=1 Tax=Trichuris muris TaxID=70415 RepID=A0A5S6QAH4_TRIMR